MDIKRLKESILKAIFVVATIYFYTTVFGTKNMLVGLVMGRAVVTLLRRDFTGSIFYRGITLLILNLTLAVFAYISAENVFAGIVLNFLAVFTSTYVYMNDFRGPSSSMFLLLYIFMWGAQVNLYELPTRLLAILFGITLVVISQLLVNKNKFKTEGSKIINEICDDILRQIEDIENNKFNTNKNFNLNKKIRNLLILINERNSQNVIKSQTKDEINHFNIAIYLERINLILNNVVEYNKNDKFKKMYLDDLKIEINNIRIFNKDVKDVDKINNDINSFIEKYNHVENKPLFLSESICLFEMFKININDADERKYRNIGEIYRNVNVPKHFELFTIMKENFHLKSLKMIFSLKLAIAITLSIFIVQYFNIEFGKWIVVTLFVIIQPYAEETKIKARNRVIGTVTGVLVFFLIYGLVYDNIHLYTVLLIAFFFHYYCKTDKMQTLFLTIFDLTSISLAHQVGVLSFDRILFTVVGMIAGILFDKYFLPYSITDSINELKEKYKQNNILILKELDKVIKETGDLDKLIKLSLLESQMENKLIDNNEKVKDESIEKLIYKHSLVMSHARYLLLQHYHNTYEHDN